VAVVVTFEGDTVQSATIAQGSVAPTIITSPEAEAFLAGKALTDDVIDEAGRLAAAAARPISDVRGSAEYRREMIRVLTRRALKAIRDGEHAADLPERPVMLWGEKQGRVTEPLAEGFAHGKDDPIVTTIN